MLLPALSGVRSLHVVYCKYFSLPGFFDAGARSADRIRVENLFYGAESARRYAAGLIVYSAVNIRVK